jgi:hypothetical protein
MVDGVALAFEPPTTFLGLSDTGPAAFSCEEVMRDADVDGSWHLDNTVVSPTRKVKAVRCCINACTRFAMLPAGDDRTIS